MANNTTTGLTGSFSGMTSFDGGGANSTINGLGNTTISNVNAGTSGANTFEGFGNLGGNNTFTFVGEGGRYHR